MSENINQHKNKNRKIIYALIFTGIITASWFIYSQFFAAKNLEKNISKENKATQTNPTNPTNPTTQKTLILQKTELTYATETKAEQIITVTGSLKAAENLIIKAKASGTIQNFNWQIGQTIRRDQIVASIENSDYDNRYQQASNQVKAALEQQELLQKQYERQNQLVADGFISANALDTISTNLAIAKTSTQNAKSNLLITKKALADQNILAPISGIVSQKHVQNGETIMPDQRLLEILNPNSIELEAQVSDRDIAFLKKGDKADVKYGGQILAGVIDRIAPATSANSRLINIYIKIPSRADLKVGAFATADLHLESNSNNLNNANSLDKMALQIPANLIQTNNTNNTNGGTENYIYTLQNNKNNNNNQLIITETPIKVLSQMQGMANVQSLSENLNIQTPLINIPISRSQVGQVVVLN